MSRQRIHGYCALCISRCGSIATVQDGRLIKVEADPENPQAIRTVRGVGYMYVPPAL